MLESPSMLRYSLYDEVCVGREANINESFGSENSSAADNQQERLVKIGMIRILRDYMPDTEFIPVKI
jgi:hypothetical protein